MKNTKEFLELVEQSIRTVANQFFYKPYNFFSEEEFKAYLFAVFYRQKEFAKTYETTDGKRTMLVHPEYPSTKRIKLEASKGYRRWYDVAILNPDFVQSNPYMSVANRAEKDACFEGKNIIAAVELKFLTGKMKQQTFALINNDVLKLDQAEEVIGKYCLIFSNCPQQDKSWLRRFKPKETKILYEEVEQTGNRKKRTIFTNPDDWLSV